MGQEVLQLGEVLIQHLAVRRVVERRGRMEHREHHQVHPADLPALGLAVDGGHAEFGIGQELGGEAAQGADDRRPDDGYLLHEVRAARRDLVGERVAVLGRAALDHVGDVDVGAGQADLAQEFRQQLAGRSHERLALLVLVKARSLAHEHQLARWDRPRRTPPGCARCRARNGRNP